MATVGSFSFFSLVAWAIATLVLVLFVHWGGPEPPIVNELAPPPPLDRLQEVIKLPPGFEITTYARVGAVQGMMGGVQDMIVGEGGTVFVRGNDQKLVALVDHNKDNVADQPIPLLHELEGAFETYHILQLAFRRGALYVTATGPYQGHFDVLRFDNIEAHLGSAPAPVVDNKNLPYVPAVFAFGPDGMIYIHVPESRSIVRMKADGSGLETFAEGIRSPFMDWHPVSHELWFADSLVLREHVVPKDMKFYSGKMFPADYQNQIFITELGDFSNGAFAGNRITLVRLENNRPVKYETFAEGWNSTGQGDYWGAPGKLLVMPDGALLVSDVKTDAIYRISYK